ncbi:MAG TPA: DUF1206 domain-containing protein [Cellvibrionaceae bacterium]
MVNRPTTPDHKDAIAFFARMGYTARGIVYVLVGGLATLAVFGQGGQTEGSRGALQWVLGAPLGNVLLGAIALGLLGYAMWRSIQAIKDPDQHGTDPKALTIRASLLASAITHTLLAIFAVSMIFTFGGSSEGSGGSQGVADWLMGLPLGRWLVGAAGLILIGAGLAHGIKGWKTKFDCHFDMPTRTQYWAYPLCRFGLAVRGLVFIITGSFFLIAAYQVDPDQAGGMAEVFSTLREQPFGPWLLAFVAVGLLAFGFYSLLEAIYRRVKPSS